MARKELNIIYSEKLIQCNSKLIEILKCGCFAGQSPYEEGLKAAKRDRQMLETLYCLTKN